jgi:hypothetical protein
VISLWRYLRAVLGNVKTYLTGGAPIALIFLADRVFHISVPRWCEILVAALAVLVAPFSAWKKEHEARGAAEKALNEAHDEAWLVPDVSADQQWLLAVIRKYGLRRKMHPKRDGTGNVNSLWIGVTPIDFDKSRWFYDELVASTRERGLIDFEGGIYHPTDEGERVLDETKRRKRPPEQPRTLIGALSDKPETFALD